MKASFWSRYFSFSGRIKRLSFFLRSLFLGLLTIGLILVSVFIATLIPRFYSPFYRPGTLAIIILLVVFLLLVVAYVLTIVSNYSLQARRLHDMGYSGLWALGFFVLCIIGIFAGGPTINGITVVSIITSLIQFIYSLVLLFWPGTKGPNRFGQDPKWRDRDYAEAVFGENSQGRSRHQKQPAPQTYNMQEFTAPQKKNYTATITHNNVTGLKGTKLSVSRKPEN